MSAYPRPLAFKVEELDDWEEYDRIMPAQAVRRLRPYEPTPSLAKISSMGEQPQPMKLDWNESTLPPSPGVARAIRNYLETGHSLNWYPPQAGAYLLAGLSQYTGLPTDGILPTNGSDDALNTICTTYLDVGDRVLVPYPTYTHFLVFAGSRGAQIEPVTYDDPYRGNLKRLMGAMTPSTRILYLVNPNNPTGVYYKPEEVAHIAQSYPSTLLVLDEAYYEFGGVSCAHLIPQFPNLIVVRTFSKSFGLAGMRIGYLLAQPARIRDLKRIHNPKSVNTLAQVAAQAALEDMEYLKMTVDQVRLAKEMVVDAFSESNIEVRNTPANWVLVKVPCPTAAVAALELERVFVRDRSCFPQLHGVLRVTVGTVEQTVQLLDRMKRAFGKLGWIPLSSQADQ